MEDILQTRRVTRSQSRGGDSATKPVPATPVSVKKAPPSAARRKGGRRALADVTNESPVAGLTPVPSGMDSTSFSKLCDASQPAQGTPGDVVLRTQVMTLLEQGGGQQPNLPRAAPSLLSQFASSPGMLAAPTPANTPANVVWPEAGESTLSVANPVHAAGPVCETSAVRQDELKSSLPLGSVNGAVASPGLVQSVKILDVVSPHLVVDLSSTTEHAPRALQFDSPEKGSEKTTLRVYKRRSTRVPEKSLVEHLAATQSSLTAPKDDDQWSVDVNVNSPPCADLPTGDTSDNQLADAKFGKDAVSCSRTPGVANKSSGCFLEPRELVSTPLVYNTNFVKFRLKKESDGQGKVERLGTPYVWKERSSATEGHFDEFGDEDYVDEEDLEDYEDYEDFEEDNFEDDDCEELCNGMSEISMTGLKGMPAFTGVHKRFHYNSDGEMEEEIVGPDDIVQNSQQTDGKVGNSSMADTEGNNGS